jgi:Domain of unknown function (DUF4442)
LLVTGAFAIRPALQARRIEVQYVAKATTDLLCVAETDEADWDQDEVPVRVKAVRRDGVAAVEGVITIGISARRV